MQSISCSLYGLIFDDRDRFPKIVDQRSFFLNIEAIKLIRNLMTMSLRFEIHSKIYTSGHWQPFDQVVLLISSQSLDELKKFEG